LSVTFCAAGAAEGLRTATSLGAWGFNVRPSASHIVHFGLIGAGIHGGRMPVETEVLTCRVPADQHRTLDFRRQRHRAEHADHGEPLAADPYLRRLRRGDVIDPQARRGHRTEHYRRIVLRCGAEESATAHLSSEHAERLGVAA
jgi:hypothetical protein